MTCTVLKATLKNTIKQLIILLFNKVKEFPFLIDTQGILAVTLYIMTDIIFSLGKRVTAQVTGQDMLGSYLDRPSSICDVKTTQREQID